MNDEQPQTSGAGRDTDGPGTGRDAAVDAGAEPGGGIDRKMLDLLVCPMTKTSLRYDAEAGELVSEAAGLAYPVRGGVPILLPSEARHLGEDGGGSGS